MRKQGVLGRAADRFADPFGDHQRAGRPECADRAERRYGDHRQRVRVPAWPLGMREGSTVTDALGGGTYRVRHGMIEVPVAALTGVVLVQ